MVFGNQDRYRQIKEATSKVKNNGDISMEIQNLGVRFYINPNYAFTIKGYYNSLFERRKHSKEFERLRAERGIYKWVWRNISLTIKSGDIFAIMGANGEGKTTLLRAMAGLLAPDEGCVVSRYRPYLLSAGIGFRDELSGYENIRIGGLFQGWSLEQIKENQRQIAEFAELSHEDLSKPMKYYSDGMRARLVFSVATFSDRKILFMDEILGAGDIGFQKKARTRMEQLMKSASTLIIVSHNKQFVLETATKAILLHKGQIVDLGETRKIVDDYERICTHSI